MAYNKDIVEKLSQFNNLSFTKKQWDIILKGCGCPKSCHFWKALRESSMCKVQALYTLVNINKESFDIIWTNYCKSNRESANKAYYRSKVRKQIKERKTVGITFYMVNGYLTTNIPTRE